MQIEASKYDIWVVELVFYKISQHKKKNWKPLGINRMIYRYVATFIKISFNSQQWDTN